ncbi:MAG: hypothetical protein WC100_03305 [Sterolibacterium sp.]
MRPLLIVVIVVGLAVISVVGYLEWSNRKKSNPRQQILKTLPKERAQIDGLMESGWKIKKVFKHTTDVGNEFGSKETVYVVLDHP